MKKLLTLFAIYCIAAFSQTKFSDGPAPPAIAYASLPTASSNTGKMFRVTDCLTTACTAGSGSLQAMLFSNGTSWQLVVANTGGGSGVDPFSIIPIQENFCNGTNTTQLIGTNGWAWALDTQPAFAGTAQFGICGLTLQSTASSGTGGLIALRGVSASGVASSGTGIFPYSLLISKAWHSRYYFYLPATVSSASYFLGFTNDTTGQVGPSGGRFSTGMRFLSGTSTNWEVVTSNGSAFVNGISMCTAAAPPATSTFYVVDLTGVGTTAITWKFYSSSTGFAAALAGSDLIAGCSTTLMSGAVEGYVPVIQVQTATTAVRSMYVYQYQMYPAQ